MDEITVKDGDELVVETDSNGNTVVRRKGASGGGCGCLVLLVLIAGLVIWFIMGSSHKEPKKGHPQDTEIALPLPLGPTDPEARRLMFENAPTLFPGKWRYRNKGLDGVAHINENGSCRFEFTNGHISSGSWTIYDKDKIDVFIVENNGTRGTRYTNTFKIISISDKDLYAKCITPGYEWNWLATREKNISSRIYEPSNKELKKASSSSSQITEIASPMSVVPETRRSMFENAPTLFPGKWRYRNKGLDGIAYINENGSCRFEFTNGHVASGSWIIYDRDNIDIIISQNNGVRGNNYTNTFKIISISDGDFYARCITPGYTWDWRATRIK